MNTLLTDKIRGQKRPVLLAEMALLHGFGAAAGRFSSVVKSESTFGPSVVLSGK